ncbi:MAG TPA: hypothetical protein VJH37_01445 [Candidatus Nanoarchaeia archaeon]|nr:hypothetical protein [Candidatus Nanoarchaeia archaeon]
MDVSKHVLASFILAWALYPFAGLQSLWVVFGGVLIDFDHYLYTLFRFKRWSIHFSYYYHRYHRREFSHYEPDILHIFHTWEAFLAVFVLAFFSSPFFFILQGMILHILMDFIILFKHDLMEARALSFLGWMRRRDYF